MDLYVVEMLRFGERELHSYVLGIYTSEEKAFAAGKYCESMRDGKYSAVISLYKTDSEFRGGKRIKDADAGLYRDQKIEIGSFVKTPEGLYGIVEALGDQWNGRKRCRVVSEQWYDIANLDRIN